MMKIFVLFFLTSFPFISVSGKNKSDPLIATVNGKKILKSQFEKKLEQRRSFPSNKTVKKEDVLNSMIARIIGAERAKRSGLQKRPEVIEKINDILYHAQISKDMEGKLQKIKISDHDVKTYYNKNKEYRTAQILLRTKAKPDPKNDGKILKVAQEISKKVREAPDKFGEFANRYSQASNAKTGGDMGFQIPVRYPPEYFNAINGKKLGTIVGPIKTQFGYHIAKVLGVKGFKDINLNMYKKIVYDQKRDILLENYFKSLRKDAKIKVNRKVLKKIN